MDVSIEMLKVARQRAASLSVDISFLLADAEALPFADQSFDTVVSSLSTCTFPNPVAVLHEMARVCKPAGRFCCWSMAEVTGVGWGAGRIAETIDMQSNSAVTE